MIYFTFKWVIFALTAAIGRQAADQFSDRHILGIGSDRRVNQKQHVNKILKVQHSVGRLPHHLTSHDIHQSIKHKLSRTDGRHTLYNRSVNCCCRRWHRSMYTENLAPVYSLLCDAVVSIMKTSDEWKVLKIISTCRATTTSDGRPFIRCHRDVNRRSSNRRKASRKT